MGTADSGTESSSIRERSANMKFLLPLGLLLVLQTLTFTEAAAAKGIQCFTCKAKAGQPNWCDRGENKVSTFVECKGDTQHAANTCYKAVVRKTGEVTRGCAPGTFNRGLNQVINTDFNGTQGVTTYLCNKKFCNSGRSVVSFLGLVITTCVLAIIL